MSETTDRPLVLFHDPCQDGFAACWCAWRVFGDRADYKGVEYGQEPPEEAAARTVYVLDFCYPLDAMRYLASFNRKLIWLDHHKSNQPVADFFYREHDYWKEKVVYNFNLTKSGARLAWEHFQQDDPPFLISLIQDRDLWKFELPKSRELNAWLSSMPHDFDEWDMIAASLSRPTKDALHATAHGVADRWIWDAYTARAIGQGEAILRVQERHVERICREAGHLAIGGYTVPAANTPIHQSEVAGKLAEGQPFACAYAIRGDGMTVYSLRSRKGGVDVSEVAAKYPGGGGHMGAAGFSLPAGVTTSNGLVQPTQAELAS